MSFNVKRMLDLIVLLMATPIILPFLLFISAVKVVFDGWPLFYNSSRIGYNSVSFKVYKFRTMVDNQEFIKNELSKLNVKGFEAIPLSSVVYTNLGRIYERYQFVEMPQFLNILKGEMSFIGYRPLPLGHLNVLEKSISSSLVLERSKFMPGITGFAQLSDKFNLDGEKRLQIEVLEGQFFEEANFLMIIMVYFSLIILTLIYVLSGRNGFAIYMRDKLLFKGFK